MSKVTGLKNVNVLSKAQYNGIANPAEDELYLISDSGYGFPSPNVSNLSLGASGTQYTAPANGFYHLRKTASAANQYIGMSATVGSLCWIPSSGSYSEVFCSVRKGEKMTVNYSAGGATNVFRFVYTEGE